MKRLLIILTTALLALGLAEDVESISLEVPDLETYLELFSSGIPTVASVDQIKNDALALFDGGNCEAAIPLLDLWAAEANKLANLYRQTLEPFYSASFDDRRSFAFARIEGWVDNESRSNRQIEDRNLAWVMLGECELRRGRRESR